MNQQLADRLKHSLILGDGAMGTMLNEEMSDALCPEAINLKNEKLILSIHHQYIEAGSMMIQTNSFGGTRIKLNAYGLGEDVAKINRKAATIAREAAGEKLLVAGNIGPTGKLMQPMGDLDFEEAVSIFS